MAAALTVRLPRSIPAYFLEAFVTAALTVWLLRSMHVYFFEASSTLVSSANVIPTSVPGEREGQVKLHLWVSPT